MFSEYTNSYTVEELSELFGVTHQVVLNWIKVGKLHATPNPVDETVWSIPKDQIKLMVNLSETFLTNRNKLIGRARLELSDPFEVYRSGEIPTHQKNNSPRTNLEEN